MADVEEIPKLRSRSCGGERSRRGNRKYVENFGLRVAADGVKDTGPSVVAFNNGVEGATASDAGLRTFAIVAGAEETNAEVVVCRGDATRS